MVIGINEENDRIGLVNPWQENMYDNPTIGWMNWEDFRRAIKATLNVEGSLQYLTSMQSVVLGLRK